MGRRSSLRRAARAVAILAVALLPLQASAGAAVLSARPSDAFVDSIGVNTHTTYNDTNYANIGAVAGALHGIGIRHIREGLALGRPDQYQALARLAALGIRPTLIMGHPGSGSVADFAATLAAFVPSVEAVEGPNEWDQSGHAGWVAELRGYLSELSYVLRSNPRLRSVQILDPSLTSAAAFSALGNINGLVDGVSLHPYPLGEMPEGAYGSMLQLASKNVVGKPVEVTETGYHNWMGDQGQPGVMPGVSERAAGIYFPRLFLANFADGIPRTFSYELLDETLPSPQAPERERHFGLLRKDFSWKPAAVALQRLIALTADPGGRPSLAPLALNFGGDTHALRSVLLRRSDGSYELALWRMTPVWNTAKGRDLFPGETTLTVSVPGGVRSWSRYVPNRSGQAVDGGGATGRIALPLGPQVTVLMLRGASPSATAARAQRKHAAGKHHRRRHRRRHHRRRPLRCKAARRHHRVPPRCRRHR